MLRSQKVAQRMQKQCSNCSRHTTFSCVYMSKMCHAPQRAMLVPWGVWVEGEVVRGVVSQGQPD